MATLIALAQGIETDYAGDTAGSVKVCRPDMSSPIGAGNVPYFHNNTSMEQAQEQGILSGSLIVKAQVNAAGDTSHLNIGVMADFDDAATYNLTIEGRNVLDGYKSGFRPFDSENDNLWTHVLNYFRDTRGLRFVKKIDIYVGNPVYGRVNGLNFVGDGLTEVEARNEYWAFEASYPWGTPGNIKSWRY